MANDSLKSALSAFRAETHGRSEHADAGLERLLAGAEARKVRRLPLAVKWLPLAAALAASSAWAALGTDRAVGLVGHVTDLTAHPTLVQAPVVQRAASVPAPAPIDPAPSPVVGTPDAPPSPTSLPVVARAASTTRAMPHATSEAGPESVLSPPPRAESVAPPAPPPAPVDEQADARAADTRDFKTAYRSHDTGSPAASIEAFDKYLAAHPAGRFVPEARYARAVALVRAGRTAEARRALAAFADAPAGSYRRDDAARVLRTLDPQ